MQTEACICYIVCFLNLSFKFFFKDEINRLKLSCSGLSTKVALLKGVTLQFTVRMFVTYSKKNIKLPNIFFSETGNV